MSSVLVRAARPPDAAALADLAARTFPLAAPASADPADLAAFISGNLTVAHFENYLSNPAALVLVATHPIGDESGSSSVLSDSAGAGSGEVREQLLGYCLAFGGSEGTPEDSFGVRHNPSVYLSKFYVDPTAHGTGVASLLMQAVKGAAADVLGSRSIWLAVNQLNERASRFYEKSGFERVGVKTMQVGAEMHADFVYETSL